jgi:hypothetical protein
MKGTALFVHFPAVPFTCDVYAAVEMTVPEPAPSTGAKENRFLKI